MVDDGPGSSSCNFLSISRTKGDTFLSRLVEALPRFKNKRQAMDISQQIESDVSAYLFTITIMNLAVAWRPVS